MFIVNSVKSVLGYRNDLLAYIHYESDAITKLQVRIFEHDYPP